MKLIIDQNSLKAPYQSLLKQAGYSYIVNRHNGQESFVRTFGRSPYPRFHVYVDEEASKLAIKVHLDQKRPSYEGSSAHSGEYDSEVVEQEIERLKQILC